MEVTSKFEVYNFDSLIKLIEENQMKSLWGNPFVLFSSITDPNTPTKILIRIVNGCEWGVEVGAKVWGVSDQYVIMTPFQPESFYIVRNVENSLIGAFKPRDLLVLGVDGAEILRKTTSTQIGSTEDLTRELLEGEEVRTILEDLRVTLVGLHK